MSDQVKAVLDAISVVVRSMPGVRRAYGYPPASVPSSELPAMVALPGEASISPVENDEDGTEFYVERIYNVSFLVAGVASGVSGEAYLNTIPFIQAGMELFMSYPFLGPGNAFRVKYLGDSGVQDNLIYADTHFYGVRFKISVTTRLRVALLE